LRSMPGNRCMLSIRSSKPNMCSFRRKYTNASALLESDGFDVRETYAAQEEALGKAGWNDPAMDAYNDYDATALRHEAPARRSCAGAIPFSSGAGGKIGYVAKRLTSLQGRSHFPIIYEQGSKSCAASFCCKHVDLVCV